MSLTRSTFRHVALLSSVFLLVACGGGGGSDPAPPTAAEPVPSSGRFTWLLRAEGRTDALRYGLSLVHPSQTGTEYVVEPASGRVTDTRLLASGTVDSARIGVTGLQSKALLYIVGGDVRRVPLEANGTDPKTRVQRAGSSSACSFVVDGEDFENPDRSRFVVSTVGPDGNCNTSDDGRAEVRLTTDASGIALAPLTEAPLAVLRDSVTLVPRAWVYPTRVVTWSASGTAGEFSIRSSTQPITRVLTATHRTLLVESALGLSMIDFPGGNSFTEWIFAMPAGGDWQSLGFDSQYFYVYRNSGDRSGSWDLQRLNRLSPAASRLGSGPGQVTVAALGRNMVYLTVFASGGNQLLRLQKAVPGATPTVVDSGPTSTLATVVTSGADVHQLWRVTGVGGALPAYTLQMVDETGTALFTSSGGGFPMLLANDERRDFNASENRTLFVFADRYGSRAWGDAVLTTFDAATRSSVVVGTLPGSSSFGADFVYGAVTAGSGSAMTGLAARSVAGVVQATDARVFSFDGRTASSLKYATQQR